MKIDAERASKILMEWERRYREEPAQFASDFERFRMSTETYGIAAGEYFIFLYHELYSLKLIAKFKDNTILIERIDPETSVRNFIFGALRRNGVILGKDNWIASHNAVAMNPMAPLSQYCLKNGDKIELLDSSVIQRIPNSGG